MKEEEVQFENAGQRILGVITVPDNGGDCLVIMIHGGPGGNKRGPGDIFVKTAEALAIKGIASLRFDLRGSGHSEGDFINTTIRGEVEDLAAASELVLSRGYRHVGLLGESLGGTIAVLGCNAHYKAMVLWFPAIHLMETSFLELFQGEHVDELASHGFVTEGTIRIGKPFLDEVKTLALEPILSTLEQPVLIIHGDSDSDVPHTQSLNAAKLIRTPCEVEIIKGGGHGLRKPEQQLRAVELTVNWFAAYLAQDKVAGIK